MPLIRVSHKHLSSGGSTASKVKGSTGLGGGQPGTS